MFVKVSKHIAAPVETVFALFTDLEHAGGRVKGIKKIELLTPGKVGKGTRFRETRVMFGREATEEMEITGFTPNQSYELGASSCGMQYRSVFQFRPEGSGTVVEAEFGGRPITFFAKLMTPMGWLMKGMMKKCLEQDMDDLKQVAEGKAT